MSENFKKESTFSIAQWVSMFFISLLAGGVGSYVVISYLNEAIGASTINEISANTMTRTRPIIQQVKTITVQQNDQIQRVAEDATNNLLTLVNKNDRGMINLNLVDVELLPLTSDGWLISNYRPLADQKNWKNYLVLTHNKEKYVIEKVVFDKYTNLYFVKTSGVNLSVNKLAGTQNGLNGATIISSNWNNEVEVLTQKTNKYGNSTTTISNADDLVEYLQTNEKPSSFVLWNLSGDVVGFVNSRLQIVSANSVNKNLSRLLNEGKVTMPRYNFSFIENKQIFDSTSLVNKQSGITIIFDTKSDQYKKARPYLAGLRNLDEIISVNDTEVLNNFQETLVNISGNSPVIFKVLRNKTELTIPYQPKLE